MKDEKRNVLRWIATLGTIGINIVVSTIIGFFIGYYLDKLLGTKPWLMFVFLIIGIITGFMNMMRILNKVIKEEEKGND